MQTQVDVVYEHAILLISGIDPESLNVEPVDSLHYSDLYTPLDPQCPTNLHWPKQPSYDNPIASVLNDGNTFFIFKLQDDEVTDLDADGEDMTEHPVLNPDSVRKAVLWWEQEDA